MNNETEKCNDQPEGERSCPAPPCSDIPVTHSVMLEIPEGEGLPRPLLQYLQSVGAGEFARNFSGGQVEIRSAKIRQHIPPLSAPFCSTLPVDEFGRDAMKALMDYFKQVSGKEPEVIHVPRELEESWRERNLFDFSETDRKFCGMKIQREADCISVS